MQVFIMQVWLLRGFGAEDFSGAPFGGRALSKNWQQILVCEGVKPGLFDDPLLHRSPCLRRANVET
jgi:hypothetical protein